MITSMTRHVHSFPWLKFGHEAYLFSEFRANASAIAKAAFLDLICYSTKQTPSFSIPANDKTLAGWVQISLNQWLKVKDLVLSQFTLGDDGRYHCNMLTDLYIDYDADKEQQEEDVSPPKEPKTRSTSAERMQRKRERDEAEALARQASQNKSSDAHVTPENVTCDASVTACDGVCDTQSVTCDADVTQGSVTCDAENVTNGGKGEDSDLDLDLNQDLDSKKSNTTPNNLAVIVPPSPIDPVLPVQMEPAQEPTKKPSRKRVTVEVLTEKDLMTTYGVFPKYAKDWLAIRDSRKAKLTGSAMELLISQSELAGITIAQAVEVCAKKGWTGFNATWNYSDIIPIQKTANDSAREKGIAAIIASGQSKPASENFINGMVGIYGDVLVNAAVISAISNKPVDVIEYIGTFLKTEARQNKRPQSKPITGNVNAAFPLAKETKLTPNQIQENKEALDELPF